MSKKVFGLYGQIGTGKSTAAKYLRGMGWDYIDQDILGHEVIEEHPVEIAEYLDLDILGDDGTIDRKRLSAAVFYDEELLQKLVDFSYPIIVQKTLDSLKYKDTVIEGAFFYKVKDSIPHTHLLYIGVERHILIERLVDRGHDLDWIHKVLESQTEIAEHQNLADFKLDNSGDTAHLYNQINNILSKIL